MSIAGRVDSTESFTFVISVEGPVSSFPLLTAVCWFVCVSFCAISTCDSSTGVGWGFGVGVGVEFGFGFGVDVDAVSPSSG